MKTEADVVFESLLDEQGHVSREKFRNFFYTRVPPRLVALPPDVPAVAAPVPAVLDLVASAPSPAPTRQKKRALSDEEEEDWEVDVESDSFELSPAEKKPKSKKTPSGSATKSKKVAAIFQPGGGRATVTKTVRTARLKAVVGSLRQGAKAKKFYNSMFGARVVPVNAELSIVPAEFEAIFGSVGQLVPSGKATSTVITRTLSDADVAELLGPFAAKIKVPTVSETRSFEKQRKMGSEPLVLHDARVVYSTNLQKAKFTINCSNGGDSELLNTDIFGWAF